MITIRKSRCRIKTLTFLLAFLLSVKSLTGQEWHFGFYTTPLISWFKTDIDEVKNSGARTGIILSAILERHLTDNWYFDGGLAFMSTSSQLKYSEASFFRFPDFTSVVAAGSTIIYRMQYLSAPASIKIKTPQSGNSVYFAEFGLDPRVLIRGTADIPSLDIKGEGARDEIERFNVGYHLNGGLEYETRSSIVLILGLGFETNIFDSTKDNDGELIDRAIQKYMKFIFGIKF